MKTRIISAAVILPVALVILLVLPAYVLTFTMSVISAFAAWELFGAINRTCPKKPSPRAAIYAIIAAVMVPFVVYIYYSFGIAVYIGVLAVFFILISLVITDFFLNLKSEKRVRPRQLLLTPVAAIVVPLMLSALVGLKMFSEIGYLLVMLPVIVTIITDSGAYFTGVAIGKHKPFPKISPNKTVEGFIGGILIGAAGLLLYGLILDLATELTISYPLLLVYGLIGAVITEIGDLSFAFVKRRCGIKDYGDIIPGHGGILDRFNSMTFSAPMMLLLITLIPAII